MELSGRGQRLEHLALAGALVGAPLAFVSGQALLAAMPREASLFATLAAHADIWLLSHVLLVIWLVLLIPMIWGIGQLLGQRGTLYRVVGSLFAVIGVVALALITGVDFALGAIAPLDATMALGPAHERISTAVISPLDQFDTALPLGLTVLGIGLYRTRSAPQWVAMLMLGGLAIPGSVDLRIVAGIVQLIGLSALGVVVVRRAGALDQRSAPGYAYNRPLAGAIITALAFVPAAAFSFERLGLALLVCAGLLVPELWQQRAGLQGQRVG